MKIKRLVSATTVAAICAYLVSESAIYRADEDLTAIAGTFASVAGTLLGFTIAALSILLAVSEKQLIVNLRKIGHYDAILHDLYFTAAGYLTAMTIGSVNNFV